MKHSIRAILLSAAALLACTAVVSCGDTSSAAATPSETQTSDETAAVTESAETEAVVNWESSGLPQKDYNGRTFTFLTLEVSGYDYSWRDTDETELNGEVLNDAIFNRNRKIEELYNITITSVSSLTPATDLSKAVSAGDATYDAVLEQINNLYPRAEEGMLVNWYDMPYTNLSAEWWDQSVVRDLTYKDKLYVCTGDISPLTNVRVYSLVFNKTLCNQLDLEMPYQYVLDGKWTLDVFNKYIADVNMDLNGDGVMDYDDRWGYLSQDGNSFMMYFAGGGTLVETDSDGNYQITMDTDRNISLAQKALEISVDKTKTLMADDYVAEQGSWAAASSWFAAGGSLMRSSVFEPVPRDYRSMDTDFGVLPYPKFDEQQEDYITLPEESSAMLAVPVTADTEFSSLILEALAAESVSTVSTAFYDVCLNGKSVRDEESSAMLDIIFANKHFDVGLICSIGNFKSMLVTLEGKGSTDVSSSFASALPKAEKALAKLTEKLDALD